VHHACLEDALFDGPSKATNAADGVDGSHVMPVASLDGPARVVDTERGAEQRVFDVVHGQGVAGQQHIDETGADELAEIRHAASVHEDRTSHDGDPPTTPLDVAD